MDNNEAISVKGLTKTFEIYDKPSDRVKELFSIKRKKYSTPFTALDDISFAINKGEFIGIIGRNGAGKSTLLKLLSGQLTATEGTVHVAGSISLLQLGVGFNRELTGIENIRFSSKLLGHSTDEIEKVVQEAIEFADIGDFIYHPVKTYSSGMYSRLSFAIGISVNPDILIIDEVLSVGDVRFASKCLAKIHELRKMGKTVLIVTHDVEKVLVFCDRAIWLNNAKIEEIGNAKTVADNYRDFMLTSKTSMKPSHSSAPTSSSSAQATTTSDPFSESTISWIDLSKYKAIQKRDVKITHAALYDKDGSESKNTFRRGDTLLLFLRIHPESDIPELRVAWNLIDKRGLIAIHSDSNFCGNNIKNLKGGKEALCKFRITLPPLKNGDFTFVLGLSVLDDILYKINNILPITIASTDDLSTQGGYVILENSSFTYEQ